MREPNLSIFDVTGKVAVVTVGDRGIGLCMARGLAKAGAAVSNGSRNQSLNAGAVAELEGPGSAAVSVQCDVTGDTLRIDGGYSIF
jgi:gluconate 5-dehydrogenase